VTELPAAVSPPRQERSRASFERVLEAGTSLLDEHGYEGFTLAEVSRRAGVSIGSIYARVKSKDDLFVVIQDRFMTVSESESTFADLDAWAELPTRDLVAGVVQALGRTFQRNARLLRVFVHRSIVDDEVAARSSRSMSGFSNDVETLLLTRRGEMRHPDPDLAVSIAFRMVWGTLASQVVRPPTLASQDELAWRTLVTELANACDAYLFGEPGQASIVS
jgi:AcrR family transcriptional regulator